MKFNWGWGILIVVVLFIAFILNLVYRCTLQRVDLVSDKYYENELKFQQQIDREKNSVSLTHDVSMRLSGKTLVLDFPQGMNPDSVHGEITFFKPDDASKDFTLKVNPGQDLIQNIDVSGIKAGWWMVELRWENLDTKYFASEKILID